MAKQCVSVRWRASCPSTDWGAASGTNRFTAGVCALQVVNVLCFFDLTGSTPPLATHGMGWCSTSLSCDVFCHQERSDALVVSLVAAGRVPLAWPESPASGSPQSASAYACRHGPAVVESAVSRSPYRSGLGLHSPGEFLLACSSSPSYNGVHSSPYGPLARR